MGISRRLSALSLGIVRTATSQLSSRCLAQFPNPCIYGVTGNSRPPARCETRYPRRCPETGTRDPVFLSTTSSLSDSQATLPAIEHPFTQTRQYSIYGKFPCDLNPHPSPTPSATVCRSLAAAQASFRPAMCHRCHGKIGYCRGFPLPKSATLSRQPHAVD